MTLCAEDGEFEIFALFGYNRDQWTIRNLPGRFDIGVTSPEIEALLASVGLERAPQPRVAPVILSADFQLVRWRLLNLQRQYQVDNPAELAEKACALANARADAARLSAMWKDLAEWQELEQRAVSLWQRLYTQ